MRDAEIGVRFPSVAFGSHAEFLAYCEQARAELDARYLHERAMALPPGVHVRPGTCAPCLRQTRFTLSTAGGEPLGDGTVVPHWREQLACDCPDRLHNRHRAMLHMIEATRRLAPWQNLLAFGRMVPVDIRLCRRIGEPVFVPRLSLAEAGGHRIAAPDASFALAVALDYLHHVPPLAAAMAELRRVLQPGGALVFTVPFRWDRPTTRSHLAPGIDAAPPAESPREVHEIGWDILQMLRDAGFARSRVHVYWSDELGYLGPFNTIFSAET